MSDIVVRNGIKKLKDNYYTNDHFFMHKKIGISTVATFSRMYIFQKYKLDGKNNEHEPRQIKCNQNKS
jgi:hypothetical protein